MKIVQSPLLGKVYDFHHLQEVLDGLGFHMNETFTYNYAAFDHALHKSKIEYDFYVRIFVDAVKGHIEKAGCEVQINNIEILKAKYHSGFFRDQEVPAEYVKQAETLLRKVHEQLGEKPEMTITDARKA